MLTLENQPAGRHPAVVFYPFQHIAEFTLKPELKSWNQQSWICSRTLSHYSSEPVPKKSMWQNKGTISEIEIKVLKLDFSWCAIWKTKLEIITLIDTFRLSKSCLLSYFSDWSCHLSISSDIHQNHEVLSVLG